MGSASTGPRDAEIMFLLPSGQAVGAKHAEDVDPLAKDRPTHPSQNPRRALLQKRHSALSMLQAPASEVWSGPVQRQS